MYVEPHTSLIPGLPHSPNRSLKPPDPQTPSRCHDAVAAAGSAMDEVGPDYSKSGCYEWSASQSVGLGWSGVLFALKKALPGMESLSPNRHCRVGSALPSGPSATDRNEILWCLGFCRLQTSSQFLRNWSSRALANLSGHFNSRSANTQHGIHSNRLNYL